MEEESLLKKQIASTRNMLFIVAAVTAIAGIFLIPQLVFPGEIIDMAVTFSLVVLYVFLAFWTKTRPYTAFRLGLAICIALMIAGLITNSPGLAGHWPSRVISVGIFLLGFADSRDAERKIKAR